jgi:hypothetical protein
MSLLGRLLSGQTAPTSAPRSPLDSNLEDQFTYNLLFPDAEALCHNDQVFPLSSGTILTPATISHFDINGEIDLDMRDVRVIIMQEATPTTGSAQLLYDSQTPPAQPPPAERHNPATGPAYGGPTIHKFTTEGKHRAEFQTSYNTTRGNPKSFWCF